MAEVPSPEVTQSQGVSGDLGAVRPLDPDATRAPDAALMCSETGPAPGQISGQPPSRTPVQLKTWGNFQLLQLLGRGGFGEVYRAWDPVLEREVALKLLLPRGPDREQEFTAILAEARAMARVHHANIVPVHGVDRREGRVGFWSEYVRGQTLNAFIAARGVMDEREAARTGVALCNALDAVHAAGLLHRDIKPGNAMRDENGRVLLMDFGLSQNLLAGSGCSGTPAFMAPEIAAGQAATVQGDLYSMGVLLRFLTTGSVTPAATVPPQLAAIVRRATEADPRMRYASAAQMGAELAGLTTQTRQKAEQPEPPSRPKKGKDGKKERQKEDRRPFLALFPIIGLALGFWFLFGQHWWAKIHETGMSVARPGYQDTLAANEALARYDIPGNTDKAIALYGSALKRTPDDALAEAGLARAYWRKYLDTSEPQWADSANQAVTKAMAMNASLAMVEMTAGAMHVDQGKFDVGLQELQKALQLDPDSAEVHGALGRAYSEQRRMDDAKQEFEQAIDLDDDWRWPYLLGAMQIDTGKFSDAEASLKTALEKTPQNARVLYDLGLVYLKENGLDDARETLKKSLKLDPRADTSISLGIVYFRQNDFEKAIATYKRAVDAAPQQFDTWGDLAETYVAAGKHETQAAEAFQKAAALAEEERKRTPNDSYTISMLGKYYASLHNETRALPLLHKAIALAPEDPDVAERVAEAYEVLGRRRDALEFIKRALQLGYSANYAKTSPTFKSLRRDPDAPPAIRDTGSSQ